MKNNSRIILCGPAAAGKDYLKNKFKERGFKVDVSYTTREKRPNEVDGIDYNFISREEFLNKINTRHNIPPFYEYVEYDGQYYATGTREWHTCDVFIMETRGIEKILPADRAESLIIYINTPFLTRVKRMKERGWDKDKITKRLLEDESKFQHFKNFDIEISS